jgi:subtilisin-like proprotein convertase family protein
MRVIGPFLFVAIFALSLLYAGLAQAESLGGTPSVIVSAFNAGNIPDNDPAGRSLNFVFNSFPGQVVSAEIELNITHTWVGDLTATLIAPNGSARLVVFGRPGQRTGAANGSPGNLSGNYIFRDFAANNLWLALPTDTAVNVPVSDYRASSAGIASTQHGGCNTSFAGVFGGFTPAAVTGVWSLVVTDTAGGDIGSVIDAKLRLYYNSVPDSLFQDGLENPAPFTASPPPTPVNSQRFAGCAPAPFDYFGSGLTSFALIRAIGPGSPQAVQWLLKNNDGSATGGVVRTSVFGNAQDQFLGGDFDGDAITDLAFWRPSLGRFSVLRSSRSGEVTLDMRLGKQGDTATVVDDYDGDGRTDFAVYRAGAGAGNPSVTEIIFSNGGRASLTTGETGALPVGGSDGNGDGRADVWIQSDAGAGVGRFRVFDSFSGGPLQDFTAGTPSDFVTLGQYVGTPVEDLMLIRTVTGAQNWFIRDSATGVLAAPVVFGVTGNSRLAADFDGDGIRDIANWAAGATPQFNWRRSSDSAVGVLVFGVAGDFPIAATDVF